MPYQTILKANGDRVRFSKQKVEVSLRRSGAAPKVAKQIAAAVAKEIGSDTTTDDIYKRAYQLLHEDHNTPVAARYSLKRAIHALGPTGFPFEQFVSRLLEYRGLKTKVGVTVEGRCVSHEIDVLAFDDNKERYIECKFHKDPGYNTNVKVPLYINSRFLDIKHRFEDLNDHSAYREPWIVTNTRFSKDAVQYAECAGIKLIGWHYPHGNGLERLVEDIGLHPITVLSTLSDREKHALLKMDKVLCVDVFEDPEILLQVGLSRTRQQQVLDEAQAVCELKPS